jgi:hypothetical protein
MRGGVTGALVLGSILLAAPPAGAGPSRTSFGAQSMAVAASSHTAGAQRVHLTLTFRYEMQCGYAGAGPLVVTFPSALKLPKRFAAHSVKLAGEAVAAKRRGHRVTVTVPPPTGVLCGTIGPGSLRLVFTRKAKLANPLRAGSYRFGATHTTHAFKAKLAID